MENLVQFLAALTAPATALGVLLTAASGLITILKNGYSHNVPVAIYLEKSSH